MSKNLEQQLGQVRIAGTLPAFMREGDKFVLTPEMQRVVEVMQPHTDIPLVLEPAPSVLAGIDGTGMWGSGGGVHSPATDRTYVDPIKGSVTTGAHELAHRGFGHPYFKGPRNYDQLDTVANPDYFGRPQINPEHLGSAEGLHASYEAYGAPIMIEEANAQGVATEAMDQAFGRRPDTNGWRDMLEYPGQYKYGSMYDPTYEAYLGANPRYGPASFTDEERLEGSRMREVARPRMERAFLEGRERLR